MIAQSMSHSGGDAVLHRQLREKPIRAVSAKGCYITLDNDQTIFDASCGAAVSCLGHGNDRVAQVMVNQMNEIDYCYSLMLSNSACEKLAENLIKGTNGAMAKAFIVCSGSEAVEASLKLARQYYMELSPKQQQRTKFIARQQSYHGNTMATLSVGHHTARRTLFEPLLLKNVSHVSPCRPWRDMRNGEGSEAYIARLAQELEDEFITLGPDTVCAFVAETVPGSTLGAMVPLPGYFKAMKEVCDRYGALLILDEVLSGMGRTGTLHAWEQEGVIPDIQPIAKALGAGYVSIAAILVNKRVVDVLSNGTGAFAHGTTYQGHPISCAVALEVQKIMEEEHLVENVRIMGERLGNRLKQGLSSHPNVGEIRGRGLLWAIEFVADQKTKEPFDPKHSLGWSLHRLGIQKYGISVLPGSGGIDGTRGDHISLAPPYNITSEDIETIVHRLTQLIEDRLGPVDKP